MLRALLIIIVLAVAAPSAAHGRLFRPVGGQGTAVSLSDEEFVGPFSSWMDATKTASTGGCTNNPTTGADNTGVTDATVAIQNCLNSLSDSTPVVYFPCGTYLVSSTLNASSLSYVALTGQDNSTAHGRCTTTLKWTGASGGKMVDFNGVAYSQFSRLTFNGNSLANILVDQAWDGSTGPFDARNEYNDDVFENGNNTTNSYGFRCGALGVGCSEVLMLRATFSNLGFGVAACNANALDLWIWYSSFSNMRVAAGNDTTDFIGGSCGSGAVHVVGSVFQGSSTYDLFNFGGTMMNVLDNYSTGSNQFINALAVDTLQRNTIINTALGGTYNTGSIQYNGETTMLDNIVENTNSSLPYVGGDGRLLAIGNSYTNGSPYSIDGGILYNFGDQTIVYGPPPPPALPGAPPNNNRTIYEAGILGAQIAICKASNGASSTFSAGACTGSPDGLKNVAHFAAGTTTVTSTLVVPANSNAQIIGDGWRTIINSTTANPIISIAGPSQVTLRGFAMTGSGSNDGIHISGVDQSGSYVYMRGDFLGVANVALALQSLNNTLVEADHLEWALDTGTYDITQSGNNHFNQFGATGGRFQTSGGAQLDFVGGWFEDSSFSPTSSISGTGSFIHSTARLEFPAADDLFDLNNFTGTFAILNSYVTPASCPYAGQTVNATGAGTGALIVEGLNSFLFPPNAVLNSAGSTVKLIGNFQETDSTCSAQTALPDSPSPITSGDLGVVASALSYFRSTKPLIPNGKPSGTSAVEIYDVTATVYGGGFGTAIQISP
jgi:hypothetical protein